ncbi:MAG: 4-(cytidine 5'-diphospho)-2-C-methyl-D-erythritol kinase [Phycisphaerales bacterium JB052]
MSIQTSPFTTRACAKLNLALSVGAPVDACGSPHHGYHPICSYMHTIDLSDAVTIERLGEGDASRFDLAWADQGTQTLAIDWPIEEDLVYRAHAAMEAHAGRTLPCVITLRKRIPAGGGLGGGSSDAASVLMGLDRVFGLGLGPCGLLPIAMTLGSDIGYFIDEADPPRPAIVSGFGEQIERVVGSHAGTEVTLILPPFGCATGPVYHAFDSGTPGRVDVDGVRRLVDAPVLADDLLFNDLSSSAVGVQPGLGVLIDQMNAVLGCRVHVTGSGSTLFVLGRFETARIHEVAPDCRVVCTRLI